MSYPYEFTNDLEFQFDKKYTDRHYTQYKCCAPNDVKFRM